MSTRLSFGEALGPREGAKARSRGRSDTPGVRLVLRAGDMARPVDVARLLARHGLSLRRAHDVLQRLAAGASVAVELAGATQARLRSDLARLGIVARAIRSPVADVRRVREHFGLSQAEFAIRFGFEVDTIQNWEQGRNSPDQATQLLLKVIEIYPEDVESVLTNADDRGN